MGLCVNSRHIDASRNSRSRRNARPDQDGNKNKRRNAHRKEQDRQNRISVQRTLFKHIVYAQEKGRAQSIQYPHSGLPDKFPLTLAHNNRLVASAVDHSRRVQFAIAPINHHIGYMPHFLLHQLRIGKVLHLIGRVVLHRSRKNTDCRRKLSLHSHQ